MAYCLRKGNNYLSNTKPDKMKQLSMALLFIAIFFTACVNRDENGSTDTSNTNFTKSETDSTRGDNPPDSSANQVSATPPDKTSMDFAMKAASGGMMEVEAGKLAQQNAKSDRVKSFGMMMVADHSKANDELKSIAAANNINIPTAMMPQHQKHIDLMTKMKGDAFDKHYIDMMVNDHVKDVDDFKKEANHTNNDAVKSFAAKTLPVLQMHLDSAKAIKSKK